MEDHSRNPLIPKKPNSENNQQVLSIDELIEQSIGDFTWPQLLQVFLLTLARVFDAPQSFVSVFTDSPPPWHCSSNYSSCSNPGSDICLLPRDAWEWDVPPNHTIVSEWGLQCASSLVRSLPASAFFAGCVVGGFSLSTLADSSLGRKNLLILSYLVMSVTSVLSVFSGDIWTYSALRFASGFARSSIGTCTVVLSSELVGKKWRGRVGIVGFLAFTLGFMYLPAIAYINRRGSSWRAIYLWISIPAIFYPFLVHFFVHESPRWLFIQGRREEAMQTLKRISPTTLESSMRIDSITTDFEVETSNTDLYSPIKVLFGQRWSFQRILIVMLLGFGIGMVYYGMPLGVGNLGFNIYLSLILNALTEIPSYLISFLFINRWNRKSSILVFCVISGICSIMCALVHQGCRLGFELASFSSDCVAVSIMMVYTLELFPTSVRNSAMSLQRQSNVVGAVISPLLISAGRGNGFLSYIVFGIVILCCGLTVVWLPETRGTTFCDTMEEQEHNINHSSSHE